MLKMLKMAGILELDKAGECSFLRLPSSCILMFTSMHPEKERLT
jgi:hypothetical protein